MKIFRLFVILVVSVIGLSSCSVVHHNTYSPNNVQLNLDMNDLQKLGEVEISVGYSTYIGFINVIDTINGVPYDGKVINKVAIPNSVAGMLKAPLNRAIYKVFEQYPDAEYLVVCNAKSHTEKLFLGSEVKASAKILVYKFK